MGSVGLVEFIQHPKGRDRGVDEWGVVPVLECSSTRTCVCVWARAHVSE